MLNTISELKRIWTDFVEEEQISPEIRPVILESWKRCKNNLVDFYGGKGKVLSDEEMKHRLEKNKELIEIASPIIKDIYNIVKETNYSVVLTDTDGILIETIENEKIRPEHRDLNFMQGTSWNEKDVGTNAIGTCLAIGQPIQVVGSEHYCKYHHVWTCSAAPIRNSEGKIIGCLNLSGRVEDVHPHTFGIVVASVKNIEKQLAILEYYRLMDTAFDSILDGLIIMNRHFEIERINNKLPHIFKMSIEEIYAIDMKKMLEDVEIEKDIFQARNKIKYTDYTLDIGKRRIDCVLNISPIVFNDEIMGVVLIIKEAKQLRKEVSKIAGFRANYTFENIITQDKKMKELIQTAKRIAKNDCSILIEGESGTGKELLAQSIHNASNCNSGPFIPINCAALPKELVESELFGYERGAFTGALKEGMPGKFELANGGTIFLDEIGEIPIEIQAKLLRVLDDHKVRRIGGTYERDLNIRIIAATNRNLYEEVAEKTFRRDLYYRLNVINLEISPLRDRPEDILTLAKFFLKSLNEENPHNPKMFSAGFKKEIITYEYKGNVRELKNTIQRAYYLCEKEIIDENYLPQKEKNNCTPYDMKPYTKSLQEIEKQSIQDALILSQGNVVQAAQYLNISRATIYRKIKQYQISTK
ncbi:transcriptional regulator of acetoin/glycerol metabolism [Alkalibaculum bacchi]|uniref:Transcriptional regulator of acetoin/glycerol metabolism n=1 Tax=Alkalibaculum bacchi TaxID=645887 RepID=A0A366IEN1_9FIRM|nr:sigma-54-dependent Fis family transcriptional regulator [Alkalibaculum bacchi]RBP68882.1 transcriptional regulator of acetoin/glycerol metabolism [Alkalibaculum bacchi]